MTRPFEGRKRHFFTVPSGGDVRVGQVQKLAWRPLAVGVEPDGFGDIGYGVTTIGPRRENAGFGFALGSDGTVTETGARVAAAGIGKYDE